MLPRPCDRVSSSRQLSGRLLEALARAPKPFVRGCLRVYFLGTIEFFSFSKDCRSLRWYRVLPLPTPHCLKSGRIIVFLCKQRCGVNNTSGFFFATSGLLTFWLLSRPGVLELFFLLFMAGNRTAAGHSVRIPIALYSHRGRGYWSVWRVQSVSLFVLSFIFAVMLSLASWKLYLPSASAGQSKHTPTPKNSEDGKHPLMNWMN